MLNLLLFLLLLDTTAGYVATTPPSAYRNVGRHTTNLTSSQYDWLCSRSHTNTAFVGVQPYAKLLLFTPGDCFKSCIEAYPRCAAVVYYNLHEGDLNNVCYTFDRNSVDENVALVPERPANPQDVIRALEIVPNCHLFDPVPPLRDEYVKSTDTLSQSKRVETVSAMSSSTTSVVGSGAWSAWTTCTPRTPHQIRSQPCDYGRLINRRRCTFGSLYPAYRTAVVVHANIPYPPMPYIHPECHTEEYDRILTRHMDQMRQICCVRKEAETREIVQKPTTTVIPNCRQICIPEEKENIYISRGMTAGHGTVTDVGVMPKSEWGEWSIWSVCSATCDHGTEIRYRKCSGDRCLGESYQVKACDNLPPCKTWSEWTPWSECRATCGLGERTRSRYCYLGKNRCHGNDFEVEQCQHAQQCGTWGPWEDWTACTAPCGRSEKTRRRYCLGVGGCIGPDRESKDCELKPCAEWAPWQEWSYCSVSCGMGVQERRRICLGVECEGPAVDEQKCDEQPCSEWMPWSQWSTCSASCGYGYISRTRMCVPPGRCEGESVEIEVCHVMDCGMWSPWQEWGYCEPGLNEEYRRRVCMGPPDSCGPEKTYEVRSCTVLPEDMWEEWSYWSVCPTCGFASQERTRKCMGPWCRGHFHDERLCDIQPCSTWGGWTTWGSCSATCGNGKRVRTRVCLNGFDCVGDSEEYQHCTGPYPCAEWQHWGEWTSCDSQCGLGKRTRMRQCVSSGYPVDQCFGPSVESTECIDRPCCEWSKWAEWTECDRACGGGKETRVRQCQRPGDAFAACECPGISKDTRDCNLYPCPTPTSTVIGVNHTKQHTGVVIDKSTVAPLPPAAPSYDCIPYSNCYQPPQPVIPLNQTNCQWTQWCDWSPCPTTCNFGLTRRHRYCVGDNRCVCTGPSLQKVNCAASEQCRKRK